jgi:protein translocase SecG subunit
MPFVLGLLAVIAVLSSVVLIFIILLQEPKGGGIAAALGGSGMEAIGPATGGVNRFTSWTAGIWMSACFLHAVLMTGGPAIGTKPAANPPGQTGGNAPSDGKKDAATPPVENDTPTKDTTPAPPK